MSAKSKLGKKGVSAFMDKALGISKKKNMQKPLPDDPNIGNVPKKRGELRDRIEAKTGEPLETTLQKAGLDNDVIENIIRPHKSTITAAQNRARIKALQNKNKTKNKKSKTSSVTGMSATFPKHVGVTAKKHGGKITYKMSGGQVVDAGYE